MDSVEEFFHDRVNNKKWFTARLLAGLSKATGRSPELIAKVIAAITFFLLIGQSAWVVCNSILVVVPLLLTFTFPNEKPPVDNMRVYWITAFVVSAFDRMLEIFPLYYVIKLCILLFLLVEPSCLNENLKRLLKAPVTSGASVLYEDEVSGASEIKGNVRSTDSSLRSQRQRLSSSARSPLTAVGITNKESATESLGAPTPYDTNPLVSTNMATRGSVDARARIPVSPAMPLGERQNVPSTYVNIPKPVAKKNAPSIRLPPNALKPTQASATDRGKFPNVSTYFDLPEQNK